MALPQMQKKTGFDARRDRSDLDKLDRSLAITQPRKTPDNELVATSSPEPYTASSLIEAKKPSVEFKTQFELDDTNSLVSPSIKTTLFLLAPVSFATL